MDDRSGTQTGPAGEDEVLRKKEFGRARGLNLGTFMVASEDTEPIEKTPEDDVKVGEQEIDAAVGTLNEMFTADLEPSDDDHEATDSVTQIAVHGEQQISRAMMVMMVLIWTAIGALVGTVFPPLLSALGLLSMALFGFALGERWIPRPSMHLLGITWVIISMKLLYGLALDAWSWGWFDSSPIGSSETLGIAMLGLVGLNVAVAFRHDEDAIAAQSALVLFAVGSSAGAVFGGAGVAVFILLAMALMHVLALLRSSGNLASLGISISYLWVGVHALSNDWSVLSLTLIPIENDLTLFLLLAVVSAANAAMAAVFVHHENWLSSAANALGLGKPGLWAVSVSIGMIGALMAIAAHRSETGYALAQLMLIATAFSASYLVVRGVPWTTLMPYVLGPTPFLLAGLALMVTGTVSIEWPFGLEAYSIFASLLAGLTVIVLLQHQTSVSDHVLWVGGIAVVILLTLLIPAEDGGTNSRILLATQGIVWLGLAGLALLRRSPSIAGVAVLTPYLWLLVFATDFESRLVSSDVLPIVLAEQDIAVWMALLVVQQVGVNMSLGSSNLNLAGRLGGFSEISARLRDSKALNLWNLSFVLAVLTFVSMARPGSLTALGLFGGMSLLILSHAFLVLQDVHRGKPRTLFTVWCVAAMTLSWKFGQEAIWSLILVLASVLLLLAAERRQKEGRTKEELERLEALPGRLLTLHLGIITSLFLIIGLEPQRQAVLTGQDGWLNDVENLRMLTVLGAISLVIYMNRILKIESLLTPTIGALGLLVSMALAGQGMDQAEIQLAALVLFVLTGAYLALQGEVRSGLKALAAQEQRREEFDEKRERLRHLVAEEMTSDKTTSVQLKHLDAEMLRLAEAQRKRSKRTDTGSADDLIIGDIHYRPVIILMFLGVAFLGAAWVSFATDGGLQALMFSAVLSVLMVGLSRLRANSIGLRLPDIAGVESPIAFCMTGLVVVHLAGRMTTGVLDGEDAFHLFVLMGSIGFLGGMGLIGRNDLGLRLPSALEAVVGLFAVDRVLALVVGGEVPVPFSFNPLEGDTMQWVLPLIGVELVLLVLVLLFDWVEGERLRRDLDDHRGALGRSAWLACCVLLSFGPASLVVVLFAARRSIAWAQPAVMLAVIAALPFALQSFNPWALTPAGMTLEPVLSASIVGIGCMVWTASIVAQEHGSWLSSALWGVHIMLYPAALLGQSLPLMVFAGLAASATAWISGIFTLRKSWRVIGAVDLGIAWLFAAVSFVAGAQVGYLLAMLAASAVLLFAVTALTQGRQEALAED
ncbi:hypothetical protein [Candidatus Poseidonia alphae]|uniref:hypothetical protein n=1 Tax=Candidatus Poseidonia alphae TaxID=1915863 RepID=UPI0030C6EB61